MEPKIMRQKEMKTVFGKRNYVILSIGSILVIIGYILSLVLGVVDTTAKGVPLPHTILISLATCVYALHPSYA